MRPDFVESVDPVRALDFNMSQVPEEKNVLDPDSDTVESVDFVCALGFSFFDHWSRFRPVLATTLPPGSRPPCDECGAPPVIVAGDRGLCGRCASQMMDADSEGDSDDSD